LAALPLDQSNRAVTAKLYAGILHHARHTHEGFRTGLALSAFVPKDGLRADARSRCKLGY
jgi:hypothetical protein